MKLNPINWPRDYKSPRVAVLDMSVEGVLCVSGNLLEGFQQEDEFQLNNLI